MIGAILSILTSSGLGAIIGTVGSIFVKKEELKAAKLKYEQDFKMAELDLRAAADERAHDIVMADKKIELTQAEGEIEKDLIEVDAFKDSLKEQFKSYGIAFVDAVRGMMRPVITLYLLGISTYVAFKISYLVGGLEHALNPDEILSIY
jgi:hypothetical protein